MSGSLGYCQTLTIATYGLSRHRPCFGANIQAHVTTKFETTEFAGITTKIINPYPSPFTMLDMTIKPGFGAPAHISATEDKTFFVIEGRVKYRIGDRTEVVEQGARVQIPRGTVHGFTNV